MYPQNLNEALNYIESPTKTSKEQKEKPIHDQQTEQNITMQNEYDEYKNDITNCDCIQHLISVLRKYESSPNYAESFLSQKRVILNDFNYFLQNYNSNDAIHYVNSSLPSCDFKECNAVLRQYRLNQPDDDDNKRQDPKYVVLQQLFDRIHCHFVHCYELGSRLTVEEEQQLNDNNLCKILSNKRNKMASIVPQNEKKQNKFCSNLGQTKVTDTMYSFGIRFFYWDYHKNFVYKQYRGPNVGGYVSQPKELYIPPKYMTFRQELTQNSVAPLNAAEYEQLLQKANDILDSDRAKKIGAHIDRFMASYKNYFFHISTYGIRDGSPIALHHILALISYTDMDDFESKFSETFRLRKEETLNELKNRHSNFHFLTKYLREAVECFGDMAVWNDNLTFYHGINCAMLFESVSVNINGPLSTTTAINVAVNFATVHGIIVAMTPNFSLKYFDCSWISRYPHEMECFYIGGILPHYFMNIINLKNDTFAGTKHFITAIRLIEGMCTGLSFDVENVASWQHKKNKSMEVKKLGLKPLDDSLKTTVKQLIRHELHRNGVREYNAAEQKLDGYIDHLLHSVCSKKQEIRICMKLFDVDQYETLRPKGGYIGYSFLKELFGKHPTSESRMINLDILCLLFPNVERITIHEVYKKEWIINLMLDIAVAFQDYDNLKIIDVIPQQEPDEIFQTVVRSVNYIKKMEEGAILFKNLKDHYLNEVIEGKMVRIEKIH